MERFRTIFLLAGLGFFGFAFVAMGLSSYTLAGREQVLTVEQLVERDGVVEDFYDLEARWPEAFRKAYGTPASEGDWKAAYAKALRHGRDIYVSEGCWHCHSQYVRPVANEELRYGPVSNALEYQNELQQPVLFGTRRVGPDLIRESGVRTNDWHAAHFYRPKLTAPVSVMPDFPWFFDESAVAGRPEAAPVPNERGLAIITYVQWLGSWRRKADSTWQEEWPAKKAAAKEGVQ
jgi:hypothetical protein